MVLNKKDEIEVLDAIEKVSEGTLQEITEELKENGLDIKESELLRYVRRLQKRKVIVANMVNGNTVYSRGDVPFPPRATMDTIVKFPKEAREVIIRKAEEKKQLPTRPRGPQIADLTYFKVEFETIDPILGGDSDEEDEITFPRDGAGNLMIRKSWWKGWFRSNLRLVNANETVATQYMSHNIGLINPSTKTITLKANGLKGPKNYEAIPSGTTVKTIIGYPMQGTPITTKKDFEDFLKLAGQYPIRGLGANPHVYGGRIIPTCFEEVSRTELLTGV